MSESLPTTEGLHIVYGEFGDSGKKKPLMVAAWWSCNRGCWTLLSKHWADAITDWMPMPDPPAHAAKQRQLASAVKTNGVYQFQLE